MSWSAAAKHGLASHLAPMLLVCALHAVVLVAFGAVARPAAVLAVVSGMVLMHVAFSFASSSERMALVPDVVAHVGAGAVIVLDGGTESPFFFWTLLLLAGQALKFVARSLWILSGFVLLVYVAVVTVTGDLTGASFGRFGLLVAYCGIVVYLRRRLDGEERRSRYFDRVMRVGFDAAPMGVALLDSDLRPVYANRAGAALVESTLADTPSAEVTSIGGTPIDAFAAARKGFEQAMAEPIVIRIVDRNIVRHLRVLSVPVEVEGRRLMLVMAEDVSAQVAAGEETTRFLQSAAHQFRTPLTPVMAYAHMLAAGDLSGSDVVEAGKTIHRGAQDLEALLDHLSTLLKLRTSRRPPAIELTMSDLISRMLDGLDRSPDVVFDGDRDLRVRCAPAPASAAMAELVSNGWHHGVPPIALAWHMEDESVVVEISDAGSGPPLADRARLADIWTTPFEDTTVSASMGQQLGIAKAVAFVGLSGGTLEFVRDERWYFALRFPLAVPRGSIDEPAEPDLAVPTDDASK